MEQKKVKMCALEKENAVFEHSFDLLAKTQLIVIEYSISFVLYLNSVFRIILSSYLRVILSSDISATMCVFSLSL